MTAYAYPTYPVSALDALGDPTRRSILELLRRGPRSVGELAKELPVTRPAVSQHLKVLGEARLVTHQKDGTRHIYRLEADGLEDARAWLEAFWAQALAELKAAAEAEERDDDQGGRNG